MTLFHHDERPGSGDVPTTTTAIDGVDAARTVGAPAHQRPADIRRFAGRRIHRSGTPRDAPSSGNVMAVVPAPMRAWQRRAVVAAAVAAAAVLVAAAVFWSTGGRWFSVATPSMGTTAPVGTLIVTAPTDVAGLHVGDVIAFVPPTEPDVTYTHRIVAISAPGTAAAGITTRGDINGAADPWTITQHDLVGRAVVISPGVGYLLRAAPLTAIGSLVVWALTRFWIRPGWRGPARMLGGAALYVISALTLRPFLGVVQLVTTTDPGGSAHLSAVSTGLLPIRLQPTPGHGIATPVDLTYGQTGMVDLRPSPGGSGNYDLTAHLHLSFWGWVGLAALWSLPTLWVLVVGFRPPLLVDDPLAERHERLLTPAEAAA